MGRSEAIGDVTPKMSENPPRSGSVSGSVVSSLTGIDGGAGRAGGGAGLAGGSAGRAGGAEGRAGGNAGLAGGAGLGGGGFDVGGGSSSNAVGASVISENKKKKNFDK
jgi:hypothetical protein